MKNTHIALFLGAVLMTNVASAKVGGIWDHFKENAWEYSVPCALSLGVGFLLAKEDKAAIGIAGCAVSGAVTYYHIKDKKAMETKIIERTDAMNASLRKEMRDYVISTGKEAMVAELKAETYKSIQESILKDKTFRTQLLAGLKQEFNEYKTVIDQVLAIKLGEFKGEISKEIEAALINGPFIQLLEEKMSSKLETKQGELFTAKKAEMVKECVEESLDQIVLKQIGVKESKIKVIE